MPSPVKRINPKDPSGMRATEEARAAISEQDMELVLAKINQRIIGVTDPLQVQRIVEEELHKYAGLSTQKQLAWTMDTLLRSQLRAGELLKTLNIKVAPRLGGGGPVRPAVRDALTINVKNQLDSLAADTQKKVTSTILQGIEAGDTPRKTANAIAENTGMELSRAKLIARDQTLKANRAASLEEYRKYGIEEVEWYTARDGRVCEECEKLDGKRFSINEIPHVHGDTDINCRCIQIPVNGGNQ